MEQPNSVWSLFKFGSIGRALLQLRVAEERSKFPLGVYRGLQHVDSVKVFIVNAESPHCWLGLLEKSLAEVQILTIFHYAAHSNIHKD